MTTEDLLRAIEHNTRLLTENIHEIVELDTSLSSVNTLYIFERLGIKKGTSVLIIDDGGGLSLGISDETPFEVVSGDMFSNELFEILRWQGSGVAGTAKLRIGGVV